MTIKQRTKVTVNGRLYEREVEPRLTLADFLRHELNLGGTRWLRAWHLRGVHRAHQRPGGALLPRARRAG